MALYQGEIFCVLRASSGNICFVLFMKQSPEWVRTSDPITRILTYNLGTNVSAQTLFADIFYISGGDERQKHQVLDVALLISLTVSANQLNLPVYVNMA